MTAPPLVWDVYDGSKWITVVTAPTEAEAVREAMRIHPEVRWRDPRACRPMDDWD